MRRKIEFIAPCDGIYLCFFFGSHCLQWLKRRVKADGEPHANGGLSPRSLPPSPLRVPWKPISVWNIPVKKIKDLNFIKIFFQIYEGEGLYIINPIIILKILIVYHYCYLVITFIIIIIIDLLYQQAVYLSFCADMQLKKIFPAYLGKSSLAVKSNMICTV